MLEFRIVQRETKGLSHFARQFEYHPFRLQGHALCELNADMHAGWVSDEPVTGAMIKQLREADELCPECERRYAQVNAQLVADPEPSVLCKGRKARLP